MREFETGATRDGEEDKYDLEGFDSPIVEQRYAQYMHEHRKQADDKLRDSDNWQKLFGDDHCAVCMKSCKRHVRAIWLAHRGYDAPDIEKSICGAIFNLKAYLFKILKEKK